MMTAFVIAQENTLLNRDFWKTNPTLTQVQDLVKKGNDPVQLNENAFDATIYALLEKADDDVVKYLLSFKGNSVDKNTHDSRIYLHWAAYAGHIEMVKYLLASGSDVTKRDSNGNTPLAFAANAGQKNKDVYQAFESHGVNLLNEKNENGANLLLLVAPSLTHESELNYFLNKGFALDSKDDLNNGIFNHAAKKGNINFLKLLVDKGVDYTSLNDKGGNAILYASMGARGSTYDVAVFKYLEKIGVNPNVVGDSGRNPLHRIAHRSNDITLFKYFIDKGVDLHLQDNGGDSPFMNIANSADLAVMEYVFAFTSTGSAQRAKAKYINHKDETGKTALTMAVSRNTASMVEFLISKNADVNVIDKKGNTLGYYLLNSYRSSNTEDFESKLALLKKSGVNLKATQQDGNSLLHIAVQKNNLDLVKHVTEFNIDVNATNDEGYTALHIAAMKAGSDAILKYLIAAGADKTITTDFEETAYDLASENELLQQHNVNLNFLQ